MRQTSYSAELKESIIRRLQGPSSPKISELSADTGISLSTLYQWRKQALSQNPGTPHDTSPHLRSAEEKWQLVKRAQELEGQELGVFLRQEGVHLVQIDEWRADILRALKPMSKKRTSRSKHNPKAAKRIKLLEAELKRKEAALAEAAALLLLSKKVEAWWAEEDADTAPRRDKRSSK